MSYFAVWDLTTANLLGEFDDRKEAEEYIVRIKPYGRYGPEGHELVISEEEEDS